MNIYDLNEKGNYNYNYSEKAVKNIKKFKKLNYISTILMLIMSVPSIIFFVKDENIDILYLCLVGVIFVKLIVVRIYNTMYKSMQNQVDDVQTYHDFTYYLYTKPRRKSVKAFHLLNIIKADFLMNNYNRAFDGLRSINEGDLPYFYKASLYMCHANYYWHSDDFTSFKKWYNKAKSISKSAFSASDRVEFEKINDNILNFIKANLVKNDYDKVLDGLKLINEKRLENNQRFTLYINYANYYWAIEDLEAFEEWCHKAEKISEIIILDSIKKKELEEINNKLLSLNK